MWNKKSNIIMAAIIVFALMGSLVDANVVEISAVNSPADLDLSGNIAYAINFGNNGNPNIGGIVFSQDQDHPNIHLDITYEGVITNWHGHYPNTGYSELDKLLGGIIWNDNRQVDQTTSVTITNSLIAGTSYQLQLIFYTSHSLPMDIIVEGKTFIERFEPFKIQGNYPGGGSVFKCVFNALDTTLNVALKPNPNVDPSAVSGLILTEIPKTTDSLVDYG